MAWTKTIQEVKIGDKVENNRNGKGMITNKTKRTIEVTFENGNKVKNTYRHNDDYFWETDF
jgi:stalled ribosome alternative rescue factor ArfA